MFDGIRTFLKGMISRMFKAKTISEKLNINTCLSDAMITQIELWSMMYKGMAPWCKGYVKSLRKEQGICREFANVCLTEMEAKVSNEELDKIFKAAIRNLNENLQSGLALGSFIIKPLGGDKVEYLTADRFIPVEFDARGRLVDVIFVQVKKMGDEDYYFRLERHTFKDGLLAITNRAFHSKNLDDLGKEVPIETVSEWASLPKSIMYKGLERPDFGYYRNPIKNEVDGSACGVSIFDSAIEQLKNVDIQGARLDWEFESGERAINVDIMALQARPVVQGKKTVYEAPRLNERLYRGLNIQEGADKELYKEWSPAFRDENIINGINAYLRQVEFNVSLAYGDLSDAQDVDKTATECIIAKQRKYNMVNAIESNLKECLEDLVYALAFYNAMTRSGYKFICDFKDSILTDEETERAQDKSDVAAGLMLPWEYRVKWYGETEEQARAKLAELEVDTEPIGE